MLRASAEIVHPRFGIAVVVPDFLLLTVEARRVLPKTYSRVFLHRQ